MNYKNSIYVGVGGSGIKTIQKVKQAFKDSNNGVVPPQIKFLCLDTDADSLDSLENIDLEEKLSLAVEDPAGRYEFEMNKHQSDMFKYYPRTNVCHLSALDQGAGQIRSNGHFAVIEHKNEIVTKLIALRDEIADIAIDPTEVIKSGKLDVHMVFSTCGGTGSGSFLPIAYLIKSTLLCNLTGYLYTHKFFEKIVEKSAVESVRENSFAALLELDYCMNPSADIPFRFGDTPVDEMVMRVNERPFDTVFLIDNKTLSVNRQVFNYANYEIAMAPVSTAMYIAAGDIATSHSSVMDNVKHKILEGNFDVANKHGWVMGLGVSKIVCDDNFRSSQTEIVLKDKLIELIISGTNADSTASSLAKTWYNDRLQINESGDADDKDHLINAILDISSEEIEATKNYIELVETSATTFADSSAKKITIKSDAVYNNIYTTLLDVLNEALKSGEGLRKISDALSLLKRSVDTATTKLGEEVAAHKNEMPAIETLAKEAGDALKKTLKDLGWGNSQAKDTARKNYHNNMVSLNKAYFSAYWNEKRKNEAIAVYAKLNRVILSLISSVNSVLDKIKDERESTLSSAERFIHTTDVSVPTLCHITNLSGMFDSILDQSISSISYSVRDFYDKNFASSFLDIVNDSSAFVARFNAYTTTAVSRMDNTLVKLCRDLRETAPELFERQLKEALRYSSPLLCIDSHNMNSLVKYNEYFYIAGEENLVSVLKEAYKSVYPNTQVTAINIGNMGNEAIIYRIVGAVPPYFVKEISGANDPLSLEHYYMEARLRNQSRQRTPFSHSVLQAALEQNSEFLTPENPADIERKAKEARHEDILNDWVNSFIFEDIVKEPDGQFYIKVKRTYPGAITKSAASRFALLLLGVDRHAAFEAFGNLQANLSSMLYKPRDYNSEEYLKYNGDVDAYIAVAMCDDKSDPLLIEETNIIISRE